jgi:hypothetical protein
VVTGDTGTLTERKPVDVEMFRTRKVTATGSIESKKILFVAEKLVAPRVIPKEKLVAKKKIRQFFLSCPIPSNVWY